MTDDALCTCVMPKRLDQVAIIVHNIDQALAFYRDVLGIAPRAIRDVPTEQVRVAFLPLGGPRWQRNRADRAEHS
jgi:predicted enzyme related to lactoylglutathione lyase